MELSTFGDATVDDMLKLVQDREALFEKMMSGPGIPATKFPRRGKPRSVLLTLVRPSGSSSGNMSSSSGGRGGAVAVGGVASFSSTASPSMLGGGEEMSPASLSSSVGHSRRGLSSTFGRNRLSGKASVLFSSDSDLFSKPSYKRSFRSQPHQRQQHQDQQGPISLKALLDVELVWNRQRGRKGSLRLGEVIEAIAGIDSQVLRPVCEELRRHAVSVGELRAGEGREDEGEGEEDTFVSLRTNRRTLDLKFSTVPMRNRFMLAFKTLAWETAAAEAGSTRGRGSRPVGSSHF
ncbi:unnamed protein product [Ectocarpus fasciculatus]